MAENLEGLAEWLKPSNLKLVHLLKLISFIFRLMLYMLICVAGMALILFPADAKVKVFSWGGLVTSSTCYFLTSKEYGFKMEATMFSASAGEETFCGLTAEEVAFEGGWQNDLIEVIAGWPFIYFCSSMFFAGCFMCCSTFDLLNTLRSKYKDLPRMTGVLRNIWTYFFLTILPNYLISPMGSVTVLPDPAETIALIRTPPDYGFISIYSLFLIMPTCCVVCGTCLFVSKDESVHDACASTYNSALACTICLVSFVVLLVIHAYMTMGNIFFIDWKFQLSFNLTFVSIAMLAKCFLGAASFVETLIFFIDTCGDVLRCKDKAQVAATPYKQ